MDYNIDRLPYIKELIDNTLINSPEIKAKEALELDIEVSLELTKKFIKELIDYLSIKEFIRLDFKDYEQIIETLSKGVIEILLLRMGVKTPLNMPYIVTKLIIEKLELDVTLDRTNLIFVHKELENILVSMISQFDIIIESIVVENTVLNVIRTAKENYTVVPKRWLLITLPVIYSADNTIFETTKLKIDLIWRVK